MSEYYFFNDVKISYKIEKWFISTFHGTVILEHSAPITFTIDYTTYTDILKIPKLYTALSYMAKIADQTINL